MESVWTRVTETFIWNILDIIIFTAVFVYVLIDAKRDNFVKGLFYIFYPLNMIYTILIMIMYRANVTAAANLFGWNGKVSFIYHFFSMFSYFLLYYGITLLVGKTLPVLASKTDYPKEGGIRRSIGVSLLLFIVTLGLYAPFWLYRTVKDLKTNFDKEIPYTPGQAVGFLFIPIFNIGWVVYLMFSLPLAMKQIEKKYFPQEAGFYFHPVLISLLWVFFGVLAALPIEKNTQLLIGKSLFCWGGYIVLYLTIQAKWNTFCHANQDSGLPKPSGATV